MTTIQEEKLRLKEELKNVWPPIFSRLSSRAAQKKGRQWEEIARSYVEQAHTKKAEISALRLILTQPHPPELLDEARRALPVFEAQLEELRALEKRALQEAQRERENMERMEAREDKEIADFEALPAGEQIVMIRRAEESFAEESFLEMRRRERRNERAAELRAERKATGAKPQRRKPR